jgi:outer membrane protein TolC
MAEMRTGILALILLAAASPLAAQTADSTRPSITLDEAIALSLRTQPGVIQAEAAVDNAAARVRSAKGAWLPSLDLSASGNQNYSGVPSRVDPNTGLAVGSSSGSVSSSLRSSITLFDGFQRSADSKSARASETAADASLVNTRYQQRLATTNQFLDARAAAELVGVRQASVNRAEEQLKVSINKLNAGSATRSDSLRSRVTLGTAQLQMIQAQAQLASAEAGLARLVGMTGRVAAADDSSFYNVIAAPLDTAALRLEAEARSPQVQAAEASAVAAQAEIRSARSGYWPTLSLSGNVGLSGSSSRDYSFYDSRGASLSLSWPIFNRFQREQSINTAENSARTADAQAADAARQVSANLTSQLANLEAARTQIEITQVSVKAAEEDLRVQQERYRLGASTIVDILTSQEALDQAEVDAVNARFGYLRAKAQIEALIGRSL